MAETTDNEVMAVELDEGEPVGPVDLDVVRSGLESEQNMVRTHAANVALGVARHDTDRAVALAPALRDALRDDHRVVVHRTAAALVVVAEEAPDRVEPVVVACPKLYVVVRIRWERCRQQSLRTGKRTCRSSGAYRTCWTG
jgi:hypothetical protein